MNAAELIELSINEDRTAVAEPTTVAEYESLLDDLLSRSDGDVDTAEHRDRVEIWSEDGWRVEIIRPAGE